MAGQSGRGSAEFFRRATLFLSGIFRKEVPADWPRLVSSAAHQSRRVHRDFRLPGKVTVLIASSRPAFRAALAQYLSQHYGLVRAVPVEELFAGEPHDLVVLDAVNLAGAFAKLPQITTALPESRIILLVSRPSDLVAAKARGAGVQGVLSEEDDLDAWRVMVGRIRATDFLTGPSFRGAPAIRSLLTDRQASVYELVVQGLSDEEAARELGISVATLETHRRDVQIKLGCGGHRELVAHALRHGLLDPIDVRLQSPLRQATRQHCANASLP